MTASREQELAALELARALGDSVRGRTSPNPPVGAIILDAHGEVVGSGATQPAGLAHAEVMALAQAGARARGGTAIVTLEPCAHTGRTGPCTGALLAAGIARVVYSVADPDPIASGGGEVLALAGIDVEGGLDAARTAAGALGPWLFAMAQGRPYVTWKFAATLDGRIAAADGTSRWITGPEARADVHRLRDVVDAVVVGSATVLADDPQLTVRTPDGGLAPGRQPLRVVMDRRGRVPDTARIFDGSAPTLSLAAAAPRFALKALYDHGARHVLLEGGATLAGSFLEAGCVDRVVAYLAPTLLGAGPTALGPSGIDTIADALKLEDVSVEVFGRDVRIVGLTHRTHEPVAAPHDTGAE
ncbi:MAG: diaminohydroxyphosphoribosylaminopyrimidine deaminase [Jatrophihabitantaceae bacterium]|nr:diaminohydroxyphosphoribosylaminopyrimidine deaminase [Jatrophihabitantaceae bacterium]